MNIKISSKVEEKVWDEFKDLSQETHQSLSGMLTEALVDYIQRKRVRPNFLKSMEESMQENEKLGKLLAQ
jgi:hypothetical protein